MMGDAVVAVRCLCGDGLMVVMGAHCHADDD